MFKLNAMSAAALACLAAAAAPALAQQQLERVEVTGSRILSENAISPAPIQVISVKEIQESGVTNLQELLLKNPVFGTPGISRTNSNFSTSSAGVASIDLRNLGSDRTLVLINGRRVVAGVPGSSTVDLNTIPTDFIEKVEVLTGGASATYGSDAVGGVVNIILKRNFEGFIFDAQTGISEKGDDKNSKFSATWGANLAGNRGNIMAHVGASTQGAVYSRDRDISAVDQYSLALANTGDGADLFTPMQPFYSSFAPQGRFFFTTPAGAKVSRTFDANGNLIPFSTNGPKGDGVGATGFNRSAYRTIAIPTDRFLLATKGDYKIADDHSVFFEGTYAATKTRTRLEPFPLSSNGTSSLGNPRGSYIPAETLVNGVLVKNPFIPDALFNQLTDRNGDGLRDYNFTRRLSDIDARTSSADRHTARVVAGLKGDLSKVWSYEAYVGYGSTSESQTSTGQINVNNFYNALLVVPGPNGPQCADATARGQGCVPINIFGANTISPAGANYVRANGSLNTSVSQRMAGASVSGEPLDLPAGPLGVAAGFEYRKEASSDVADALTQAGLNAGNARPPTSGQFDVREVYAEVRAPLLKNLPAMRSLDASAAVRLANYSTVGHVSSWTTGADWAINDMFRVRSTRSLSTRAPNIGELYQGASQTFPTGLVDPCKGITAASTGPVSDACRLDAGVNANIAANGSFQQTQADLQGISGFDSGNPKLKAEKGKSWTLGLAVTPTSIPLLKGFSFTADYFDIKIADAIENPGRQYALNQCYGGGNASFCKDISRRQTVVGANSAGSLEFINQTPANTGTAGVKGVDLTAAYSTKLYSGTLNSRLSYTHLVAQFKQPTPDAVRDPIDGEVGASRNRWTLNLGYDYRDFSISTTTTFIGEAHLENQFMESNGFTRDQGMVKRKAYFDTQLGYRIGKGQIYFGVNNLFNTAPPPIISGLPGNTTGAETDAGTYDAIGRRYYAGIRFKF